MRILFSHHALLKLKQRDIAKEKVLKTVENPDYLFPFLGGRKAVYKKFGKLYLKVIVRTEGNRSVVITQYWERDFKPPRV